MTIADKTVLVTGALWLAKNYWPKKSNSRASVTLWQRNATSCPGSKSIRIMFSIHRKARKVWLTCSTAEASSSSITSCSARNGTKAAPVAHSGRFAYDVE